MSKTKSALGRGLSTLIPENSTPIPKKDSQVQQAENDKENSLEIVNIPIWDLSAGKFQPRTYFDESKLDELMQSIKENGVLQPILARPNKNDANTYQIIAGERRWRASKMAGLDFIPVVIKDINDKDALELALIENIQRQSLTPIEEADGYKKLLEEFAYTQEQLAKSVGKSRSHVTNILRLLQLPNEVKDLVNDGSLSMGHARALIGVENSTDLARQIIDERLSVRDIEGMISENKNTTKKNRSKRLSKNDSSESEGYKDEDLLALEQSVSQKLGLKVIIEDSDDGGKFTIQFSNLSELDRILQKLN